MDYFDLAKEHGGKLANAFRDTPVRFCVVSFTSDWLFPTAENRSIVHALNACAADVSFVEIASDAGHDAFLLDEPEFSATLAGFIAGCAERRGLNGRCTRETRQRRWRPSKGRRSRCARHDRKSVVTGKGWSGRVEPGGR